MKKLPVFACEVCGRPVSKWRRLGYTCTMPCENEKLRRALEAMTPGVRILNSIGVRW